LWVDHGCRGLFQEIQPPHGEHRVRRHGDDAGWDGDDQGWGWASGGHRIVLCESNDRRRKFRSGRTGRRPRLVEQVPRSACREGYSYGFTPDGVWVDQGCRGRFDTDR
jgi:hypothetical protein